VLREERLHLDLLNLLLKLKNSLRNLQSDKQINLLHRFTDAAGSQSEVLAAMKLEIMSLFLHL
jgi:hypothetical protein